MTNNAPRREPVFNVPPVVTAMLAVVFAVQLLRGSLAEADDIWFVQALGFIPGRYEGASPPFPGGALAAWTSPLTHMLVHGDWTHLIFNSASLLAFGGVVARRLGPARFMAFTLFSGLSGALLFLVMNPALPSPMIGASGAISGMMAAALRLLFSAVESAPPGQAGEYVRKAPKRIVRMDLSATLRDPRLRSATLIWLGINALGAFGLAAPSEAGTIAWEAHIGGYFAGLLGLGLFDRQGRPANADAATAMPQRSEPWR